MPEQTPGTESVTAYGAAALRNRALHRCHAPAPSRSPGEAGEPLLNERSFYSPAIPGSLSNFNVKHLQPGNGMRCSAGPLPGL